MLVFCEVMEVDVDEVVYVIGIDLWIGFKFFKVLVGFGGFCF